MKRTRTMVKRSPAKKKKKRMRVEEATAGTNSNWFDALSDDLVISILINIARSAHSPSHLFHIMSSCKRMKNLCMDPVVLRNASLHAVSIPAKSWCDEAHHFLSHCADAENIEACYMLGMIEFYCLEHYARGADLLARAAQASHIEALYSLGIIHFNGSGNGSGPHCQHDPKKAVSLFAKSALLGHADAISDIRYYIWSSTQIPYPPNLIQRIFVEELDAEKSKVEAELEKDLGESRLDQQPGTQTHPANVFLTEWWQLPDVRNKRKSSDLEICSRLCGRRESKRNEFTRCHCSKTFYCSDACQLMHCVLEGYHTCAPAMIHE